MAQATHWVKYRKWAYMQCVNLTIKHLTVFKCALWVVWSQCMSVAPPLARWKRELVMSRGSGSQRPGMFRNSNQEMSNHVFTPPNVRCLCYSFYHVIASFLVCSSTGGMGFADWIYTVDGWDYPSVPTWLIRRVHKAPLRQVIFQDSKSTPLRDLVCIYK